MTRKFRCRFVNKPWHSEHPEPFGEVRVTVSDSGIRFGKWIFTDDRYSELPERLISCHRDTIKRHVDRFLQEPAYCYLWDSESGWETFITEVL